MKNFRFDALTLILINAIMPVMCAIFPSQKMVALTYIMASLILVVSGNIRRIFKATKDIYNRNNSNNKVHTDLL